MEFNEFYRRLRFALSLDDAATVKLFADLPAARRREPVPAAVRVAAWRGKPEDPAYEPMSEAALRDFIDALVQQHRGPPPDAGDAAGTAGTADAIPSRFDNNALLKGVRVALSLRTDEIAECIVAGGGRIGEPAVNAFFRKPGSRNYRACGDQVLRQFLKGLAIRQRGTGQ